MADEDDNPTLFELPDPVPVEPKTLPIHQAIWTQNKARLIERYLYYFVMVTRHGTYIDGFAGPQDPDSPDSWAAKLVLESEPRWLRHFYLYDVDPQKVEALRALRDAQPVVESRTIEVSDAGDFNVLVHELLTSRKIGEREATFCLLDQRTFECDWATIRALAEYKATGHKIELFYFFPVKWLDRALSGLRDDEKLERWWGRADFTQLRSMRSHDRVVLLRERFKEELGYASAKPWPIFERFGGGAVMYYMVHATDHRDAPGLMSRAYRRAVSPREPPEQLMFEFTALDSDEP